MGVETELFGLKNRWDGKEFRVIERADGSIAVLAGEKVLVDSGVTPVTAVPSDGGSKYIICGPLTSGEWVSVPAIFKLLLSGNGDVIVEARDANGVVTSVLQSSLSAAENKVEFPYLGDSAQAMRATFPETVSVRIF